MKQFMQKALNAFSAIAGGGGSAKTATFQGEQVSTVMSLLRRYGTNKLEYPYKEHVWVYACIRVLALSLSALPVVFFRGDRKDPERVEDKVLDALLENPCQQCSSMEELWQFTSIYLDSEGECFWILVGRDAPGKDPELILPRSGKLFEPVKERGWIVGWKYNAATPLDLGWNQVIQFKYPNPYDQDRGLSPFDAVKQSAESDYKALQFNNAFFENGCVVSGTLESEQKLSPETARRMRRQFEQVHGGAKNSFRIAVLEQGVKFTPINISHRDMEFGKQREISRNEIISAYGCNKHVVGLTEDYNKANSYEAERAFHVRGVRPRGKLIAGTLWANWLKYRPSRTWLEFDDSKLECLQADKEQQSRIAEAFFRIGFTRSAVNEILSLGFDLSKDPYKDTAYLPLSYIPEHLIEDKVKAGGLLGGFGEGGKVSGAEQLLQAMLLYSAAMGRTIRPAEERLVLTTAQERMLAAGADGKTAKLSTADTPELPEYLFDDKEMFKILKAGLEPIFEDVLRQSLKTLAGEIGGGEIEYDPDADVWKRFFDRKWLKVKTIPERHHEALRRIIGDDISDGRTLQEIAADLKSRFDTSSTYMAQRIARTEVMDVLDGSRFEGMKAEGIEYHAWVTAGDAEVRESHARLDGAVAKIGEEFPGSSLRYPHDPKAPAGEVVQCRCTCRPVVDEEEIEAGKAVNGDLWAKSVESIADKAELRAYRVCRSWFRRVLKETLESLEAANAAS